MARAGRFGTKGLAITFVSDENDAKILNDVQDRFEVNVAELPEEIDISSYSKLLLTDLSPLQGDSYHLCVLVEFKMFLRLKYMATILQFKPLMLVNPLLLSAGECWHLSE